eukprot:11190461-Lingulodinium_polyedra.AAC.1
MVTEFQRRFRSAGPFARAPGMPLERSVCNCTDAAARLQWQVWAPSSARCLTCGKRVGNPVVLASMQH